MSIGDFISKTASDALGRIIASAPQKFLSLVTSAAWIETDLDWFVYHHLKKLLDDTATKVWSPVAEYDIERSGVGRHAIEVVAQRYGGLYLVGGGNPVHLRRWYAAEKGWRTGVGRLRGFDIEALLRKAVSGIDYVHGGRIRKLDLKNNEVTESRPATIRDKPYWASPALQALLQDGKRWFDSADDCARLGLPWRRGWLLHGPPGNGKSSAASILARHLGVDLLPINLNVPDSHFFRLWEAAQLHCPCIVLIEDIDDIFHGRNNVKMPEDGVSFSTFINCIDGVDSTDGVAVIVTTNSLAAVDPALGRPRDESQWNQLSTRPGRLDRCIRFDNPDLRGRTELGKLVLPEERVAVLAQRHDDVSLVQFQAICREEAFSVLNGGGDPVSVVSPPVPPPRPAMEFSLNLLDNDNRLHRMLGDGTFRLASRDAWHLQGGDRPFATLTQAYACADELAGQVVVLGDASVPIVRCGSLPPEDGKHAVALVLCEHNRVPAAPRLADIQAAVAADAAGQGARSCLVLHLDGRVELEGFDEYDWARPRAAARTEWLSLEAAASPLLAVELQRKLAAALLEHIRTGEMGAVARRP